jgi:hypothetical protein
VSAPSRAIGNEIPVSVRLENTGNVAVMASGTLTLRDATSRVTAVIPVTRAPVIPGYPRTLRFKIPAPVIPGSVRVTADIGFGEGVPRDTATTMAFAVTWWQAGVVVLVLLVLVRLVVALVRRRRRRKAAKRRAPATVAAPPATAATAAARTNGAAVAASPSRAAPILADDELQSFWDDPDARRYEGAEPEVEVEPEPEKEPAISAFAPETPEPQTGPSPYAALEPEPAPEPEPLPAASLTVVPPVAAPAQAEPEEEPVGARVSALVDRVKAGMPEGPAGGPQASLRRALVALELMTERGARSVERIDVGLGLLRWATGDEAVAAVEAAFDGAAAAGKKSAIGAIALAMAEVGSPRATEALLRAYAAAPRHLAKRLRDALRSTPEEELRDRGELLAALPEDRRSALKVG